MGTVGYTGMWQNQQFLPFSVNATVGNAGVVVPVTLNTGQPAASLASLPAQSLNGQISTLLFNNVVTTQITPDLKTKFAYRYYDYDNQTPQITIRDWALTDATSAAGVTAQYAPVNALNVAYKRQNGTAEATWRPVNTVNLGSAYNFERYDFTRFDASSTTENSAKVYGDWKPAMWATFRASGSFGERRAGNYDYLNNVGIFQWQTPRVSAAIPSGFPNTSTQYSPLYRQFYLDDRDRATARAQVDVDLVRGLTVSPTVVWRDDEFLLQTNQVGLTHDRSTAAGVEAAYVASPNLRFLFSYMNEQRNQFELASNTVVAPFSTQTAYTCPAAAAPSTFSTCQLYSANIQDRVNTFIIGANWAAIPRRLEFGVNYTDSFGKVSSPLVQQNGTGPVLSTLTTAGNVTSAAMQFPDVTTHYQRLELNGKYVFDPEVVRNAGLKGEVSLRLRYAWERNSVTSWNNDLAMPYMFTVQPQTNTLYYQSMAWNNPNYNVHLLGGTVAWAW
jgi:MtrB/PioB family decaheme-associated outer membrane protein